MSKKQFIPFSELKHTKAIIIDSNHPNGLVLSHWRGAPTPAGLRDDTSAGIVLNALRLHVAGLELPYVTANHFDIDGFIGVWSLLNPEPALEQEELLRQMALIGDFRELNLNHPLAGEALKLVCWLNAKEKELFWPPFGAESLPESEVLVCHKKFKYFLRSFTQVLQDPDWERGVWEDEVGDALLGYREIFSPKTQLKRYPELGLIVIQTPNPVHYYGLFSRTIGFDIVLACYDENKYELEYKYTTWIDLVSRPTLPRISMAPLADKLNQLEKSGRTWTYDAITETGPILRLSGDGLSRAETFNNPTEREIYASSIEKEEVIQVVVQYYQEAYDTIQPKFNWSWKEIKSLNSKI
jgi:hypothetical protein